jgi:GTPase SAR1 family protein
MARDTAYHVAEWEIETTRRSGAYKLRLRYATLTELPESLGQLTFLQSLQISDNLLEMLPESLGQLWRLRLLDVSRNQLTALPESLGQLEELQSLILTRNQLTVLPESLGQLAHLESLDLGNNKLTMLPESLGQLTQLQHLNLSSNRLTALPERLVQLTKLRDLFLSQNQLTVLPEWIGQITQVQSLDFSDNQLTDLPLSIIQPEHLRYLKLDNNPLNPELAAAYAQGLGGVKAYLRAKAAAHITLNEAKLILVGEGEVGKTCLMDALLGNPWREHDTTHGIEIKPVKVTDTDSNTEIVLNGWDFGGQRVYRPTHQLFFSAPAVYLVVWKPREGPQQGFVREWIHLIKRREPTAKILVVATHGGPQQRQPDIDRQELWDLFGRETVVDFFHVESKPDEQGERRGVEELKSAIARVAATLPEVGRSVPKSFQETWQGLQDTGAAYLPLESVLAICREHEMDDEVARLFVTISHRLGHLIHYQHDPALRDLVVLKPDWLATAVSFVLDDEITRRAHGLVRLSHLSRLWDDPTRPADTRYPAALHPIFLRLMERFDLSYRVADPAARDDADPLSLIAQLVPDVRPDNLDAAWLAAPSAGDLQQTQICRIVDAQNGGSAAAEGLFYQLIVRLHKYSLGRADYNDSVHWQRGLVLENAYNGRALLEHKGNDVHISVRAPYPERLLTMLTEEAKYLVESFWEGLRCNIMVPCIEPCGVNKPGSGLYDVKSLIDSAKEGHPKFPCPTCNKWQDIGLLLANAPVAARPIPLDDLLTEVAAINRKLDNVGVQKVGPTPDSLRTRLRQGLAGCFNEEELRTLCFDLELDYESLPAQGKDGKAREIVAYFERIGSTARLIEHCRLLRPQGRWAEIPERLPHITLSRIDEKYAEFLQAFADEAKEGPRLFSLVPVDRSGFDPRAWKHANFRLTLWCEHSHLPLPMLNAEKDRNKGIYEIELTREWFRKAAPFLKMAIGTLSLVQRMPPSSVNLVLDEAAFKAIEEQLDFGKSVIDAVIGEGTKIGDRMGAGESARLEQGEAMRAQGETLREFQALLKAKDPGFGGLVRVMNKRQEFLWVHPQFEKEY